MKINSKALALVIALIVLLLVVPTAMAEPVNPGDTFTGIGNNASTAYGTTDGDNLGINSGGLLPGSCNATQTIFLKWDLAGINQVVGDTTSLTLFVNSAQAGNNGQVALFKVADDAWDEATLAGTTPPPDLGVQITSVDIPTTAGGPIVFTGAALASWIHENTVYVGGADVTAGNDKVSFAIQITDCFGFINPVQFDSKDKVGGVAPVLLVPGPTAVTVSAFHAVNPVLNWSLMTGLAFLAAFGVIGALVLARRRG